MYGYVPHDRLVRDWSMLCWTAKDIDTGEIVGDSNHMYPALFEKDPLNDFSICYSLWNLMDTADILIAHNGAAFDVRKAKARFYHYGFRPPSPVKVVDTCKLSRQVFGFTSHSLDYISQKRGERKLKTSIDLWDRCEAGDADAFIEMWKYNIKDVDLLVKEARNILPWAPFSLANVVYLSDDEEDICPSCGGKLTPWDKRLGYKRYNCRTCGRWARRKIGVRKDGVLR